MPLFINKTQNGRRWNMYSNIKIRADGVHQSWSIMLSLGDFIPLNIISEKVSIKGRSAWCISHESWYIAAVNSYIAPTICKQQFPQQRKWLLFINLCVSNFFTIIYKLCINTTLKIKFGFLLKNKRRVYPPHGTITNSWHRLSTFFFQQ